MLNKLDKLEENQKKAKERNEEAHKEVQREVQNLGEKMDDMRREFRESVENQRLELRQTIREQDVTNKTAELRTRQTIIGAALIVIIGVVTYLHFGFQLIP